MGKIIENINKKAEKGIKIYKKELNKKVNEDIEYYNKIEKEKREIFIY